MSNLLERTKAFLKSEDGPTATEYAVLLALIVIAIIVAVSTLGGKVRDTFQTTADHMPTSP
ncbi:MAG TPA: Flp family type IVb pilin [Phycisphaerae bacterium]|nr:Flp family type IVb pilin [Phycisphaerae bacterium]